MLPNEGARLGPSGRCKSLRSLLPRKADSPAAEFSVAPLPLLVAVVGDVGPPSPGIGAGRALAKSDAITDGAEP
jgi:hypothetical protein